MTVILVIIAVGAVLGGTLALGIWIGRCVAEDRAADAAARHKLAAIEARRARPTLLLEPPRHPADYLGPGRLPGYAGPFPRPGRLDVAAVAVTVVDLPAVDVAAAGAPYLGPSRPPTSPDDLEAEVRRMCQESELYVAALIARTRHAERIHTW